MPNSRLEYPLADRALAQRLERAEARSNAEFVETRARLQPASHAAWQEVAGAYAMFDGVASPLTQTFGLGLFEPVTPQVLERLETFFHERDAPVYHEVSPLADASVLGLLHERGYAPIELTSVMYLPLAGLTTASFALGNEHITARPIRADEQERWAQTSALGWSEAPEYHDLMLDLARIIAAKTDAPAFIAKRDGVAIATGGLSLCDGVALLAGASTIPSARQQGAQLALLAARLQYAVARDCDLAMMCALPGSASQRNAERQGFRIAYTRIKWAKAQTG